MSSPVVTRCAPSPTGYLHLGADTDGTTFPGDVGLDRGLAKKAANFVGRRASLRPVANDPNRLQPAVALPAASRPPAPAGATTPPEPPPPPHHT